MLYTSLPCPRCRAPLGSELLWRGGPILCPQCNTTLVLQDSNPNSLTWYFARQNQEEIGPFSWGQLRQLAAHGVLQPTDLLWRDGMPNRLAAGALGLFVPAPRARRRPAGKPTCRPPGNRPRARPLIPAAGWFRRLLRSVRLGSIALLLLARRFRDRQETRRRRDGRRLPAQQRGADRPIALKVLSKALASKPEYVQRFFREASVLSRLHHPNIVEFCGAGEDKGLPYFAMEFIDGFTLASLMDRRGGRMEIRDALYVVLAAARGLGYAHERSVIHRDIKPTNIMISRLGHVKLTDLGLARPLDEDLSLTTSGASIGTPHYMAPEQAHDAAQADPRSDVYGLGGVLYHLLTGALPFQGESVVSLMLAKERGHFPRPAGSISAVPDRLT